ncbi:MAG: YnfA family protein [Candidatus Rokuibacteriota bacterium]
MTTIGSSVALFVLAGLCEIGGSDLVWQWWRNGAPWLSGMAEAVILVTYGVVPTYQAAFVGRVYAAYGGVFIVRSVAWGALVDRVAPGRFDLLGTVIGLLGVAVIMYGPR